MKWIKTSKELPYPQDHSIMGLEFGDSPEWLLIKVPPYSGVHKACFMFLEGEDEEDAAFYTNMFSKVVKPVTEWCNPN